MCVSNTIKIGGGQKKKPSPCIREEEKKKKRNNTHRIVHRDTDRSLHRIYSRVCRKAKSGRGRERDIEKERETTSSSPPPVSHRSRFHLFKYSSSRPSASRRKPGSQVPFSVDLRNGRESQNIGGSSSLPAQPTHIFDRLRQQFPPPRSISGERDDLEHDFELLDA